MKVQASTKVRSLSLHSLERQATTYSSFFVQFTTRIQASKCYLWFIFFIVSPFYQNMSQLGTQRK